MVEIIKQLSRLAPTRLFILGDLMLDRFVHGDAERVSAEASALVLRFDREDTRPGGAASLAVMARALSPKVRVAGVIGADDSGRMLTGLLDKTGLDCRTILTDASRPITLKERFLGQVSKGPWQQLLRVDRESRVPLPEDLDQPDHAAAA
jgi:D-beta-D-heptose 7-phosphate kinase/D-beta-D-heptose 1-phosphate adenosyltransferase